MIARTGWLLRSASSGELAGFALIGVIAVLLIGISGSAVTMAVPELVEAQPGITGAYLVEVFGVLWPVALLLVGFFIAYENYKTFQNTIARCELAEDELAWIKRSPEHERMVEDRELMRLAANAGRVCRSYEATHALFERFLEEYRMTLDDYGGGVDKTIQKARIELLNNQAEEGLERHAARASREGMRKERRGG